VNSECLADIEETSAVRQDDDSSQAGAGGLPAKGGERSARRIPLVRCSGYSTTGAACAGSQPHARAGVAWTDLDGAGATWSPRTVLVHGWHRGVAGLLRCLTLPQTPFRATLAGIDVEILTLDAPVRAWTAARHQRPSSVQIRNLSEHAALAELERCGAKAGERWWVVVGEQVRAKRRTSDR
jgi:hypothetical protein